MAGQGEPPVIPDSKPHKRDLLGGKPQVCSGEKKQRTEQKVGFIWDFFGGRGFQGGLGLVGFCGLILKLRD